jgi:hypothetical protein
VRSFRPWTGESQYALGGYELPIPRLATRRSGMSREELANLLER